jgi:hypothetical protein
VGLPRLVPAPDEPPAARLRFRLELALGDLDAAGLIEQYIHSTGPSLHREF